MRQPLDVKSNIILNGKYLISELVSEQGSSALVYKAHVIKDGVIQIENPVIIKEFFPMILAGSGFIKREGEKLVCQDIFASLFRNEIDDFKEQALINNICGYDEQSDARNIASAYMDTFEENGTVYIVLSSLNGITLERIYNNKELPKNKEAFIKVLELIKNIAYAIEPQHEKGYVNLDIKPDNIMISNTTSGYNVALLDYGSCLPIKRQYTQDEIEVLARRVSNSDEFSSENVIGLFEACEDFLISKTKEKEQKLIEMLEPISCFDDIYSISVLFFDMLTGSRTIENYKEDIDSIDYLNAAEKDWLLHIFSQSVEVGYEDIEHFICDLDYLEETLTKSHINRHVVWSNSIEFYEQNKAGRYFRTEHKFIIDSTRANMKLPIWAVTDDNEEGIAVELIEKYSGENIYLQGLGGAGKSFISAEVYKKNICDGTTIPVFFDLEWLNNADYDQNNANVIVQGIYNEYYRGIGSLDDLVNLFILNNNKHKDYMLIIDNLHKASNELELLVYAALREIIYSCNNVQMLLIGRNSLANDIIMERVIRILGAESDSVNIYIPYKKGPYELPFLLMKYLELTDEKVRFVDGFDMRRNNTAIVLYKYFKGMKNFGTFAAVNSNNYSSISQLIENIYPKLAYEKMHQSTIISKNTVESILKGSGIDLEEFIQLSTENIAVLEYKDQVFEFTHDYYEEYFAGYYLASIVKSVIDSETIYETIAVAKLANCLWEQDAANFAIQIVKCLLDTNSRLLIEEAEIFSKLEDIKDDKIAIYYKYWPINICRLFYGYKEILDDYMLEKSTYSTYLEIENLLKWAELGIEFSCEHAYNFAGVLYTLTCEKDFEKAIACLEKAGEQGLGVGYYNLGLIYLNRLNDEDKALEYLSKASQLGIIKAKVRKAQIYIKREDNSLDFNKGIELYESAAISGSFEAQYALGELYYYSDDESKWSVAVEWYEKAASQGYHLAQSMLGWLYLHGNIVEKNIDVAEKWLLEAARKENAEAQYTLSCLYMDESSDKKNSVEARKWLIKAGKNGNQPAQTTLGDIFHFGKDEKIDFQEAFYWYEKAAKQGDAYSQYRLGHLYYSGKGSKRDDKKAINQFMKSMESGYSLASNALGHMYEYGYGVEKDLIKAKELYLQAMSNNVVYALNNLAGLYMKVGECKKALKLYNKAMVYESKEALYNIGFLYTEGNGLKKNVDTGMKMIIAAANSGCAEATTNIGSMYYSGEVMDKNVKKAFLWYLKAAEQGDPIAQCNVGSMYYRGEGTEKNVEEAFLWYLKAAEQGDSIAEYNIGSMYYSGEGTNEDYAKGWDWYSRAYAQGNVSAEAALKSIIYFWNKDLKKHFECDTIIRCRISRQLRSPLKPRS